MGLVERRAVKDFQDNVYPKLKQGLDAAAGFALPLEVKWDGLTQGIEDYAHYCQEGFEKVYFTPLLEALKGICIDDLGREALKSGLKNVVLAWSGSDTVIGFEGGVLTVDHHPVTNIDEWPDRRDQIQKALEKGL